MPHFLSQVNAVLIWSNSESVWLGLCPFDRFFYWGSAIKKTWQGKQGKIWVFLRVQKAKPYLFCIYCMQDNRDRRINRVHDGGKGRGKSFEGDSGGATDEANPTAGWGLGEGKGSAINFVHCGPSYNLSTGCQECYENSALFAQFSYPS